MLAVDGTFIAPVVLAVAAVIGILASLYATRTSFNSERDALRASVRPLIVEGIGGSAHLDPDDDRLIVPIRNVGPGVAAIRSVMIGPEGCETTGVCDQQVVPYDATFAHAKASGSFDRTLDDASVRIRYEGIGNERFETVLLLHALREDQFFVGAVRVYFCEKNWTRIKPPFIDSTPPSPKASTT